MSNNWIDSVLLPISLNTQTLMLTDVQIPFLGTPSVPPSTRDPRLERARADSASARSLPGGVRRHPGYSSTIRKGTTGVRTHGVAANVMVFDRGTFLVLPLTYLYLPKSARAYLFLILSNNCYFCSGPISVDPICPQPKHYCNWSLEGMLTAVSGRSM